MAAATGSASPIDYLFGRNHSAPAASTQQGIPPPTGSSSPSTALPPRPLATRKSSFMGLTAALSAATAASSTAPTQTESSNGATAAIALNGDAQSSRQAEGYYGDSNANLSPAALDFLASLPDLSYLLS